jgi:protein arginine N-methyltransferase 1
MYSLHDYTRMISDEARMGAYVRALEAVVQPGSVVVDVGTGSGILALVACRLGARRVFAIDKNDAVEVGRELARENGVADRIVFFHEDARDVEISERADVIVSDLRGTLPIAGDNLAVIADARTRFLKPGGVLIPARDRLMVAVVERRDLYDWAIGPARGPHGVTLEAMRARLSNALCADRGNAPLRAADVVSTAAEWAIVDYAIVQASVIAGRAELHIERGSIGHGLVLWFESVLAGDHGFTTGPGHELCYGRCFLPWERPVDLTKGDDVTVEIWAQTTGDPWGWNSVASSCGTIRAAFKQSSFLSSPARPSARADRSAAALSQAARS